MTVAKNQPRMRSSMRRMRAFTLIEVMIVVVIIAIIAALAFPAYQQHVRKSHRVDAQGAMLDLAQRLERCYTMNNSYMAAACPEGPETTDRYTLTIDDLAAHTYTITATPGATGGQNADPCGTMTVDHTGARDATGPGSADCW